MRGTRFDRRGYILLEVVASLVILAFGILALGRAISISLQASHVAQDYTTAALLAQNVLHEVEVSTKPERLARAGEFDLGDEFPMFAWKRTIRKVDDMIGVTVAVSFNRYGVDYDVQLASAVAARE